MGIFGNKHDQKNEKKNSTIDLERYNGKPLLIILENYVLDCLDKFDSEKNQQMVQVVKKVFGGSEDWKKTIRETLELPDTLDNAIKEIWEKNQIIAKTKNEQLSQIDFSKMFVDSNFKELI